MQVRGIGDPRLEALFGADEPKDVGIRPVVRLPRSGPSGWTIAAFALVAGVVLFWVLESRRTAPSQPSFSRAADDMSVFAPAPPPLYIPPAPPAVGPAIIGAPPITSRGSTPAVLPPPVVSSSGPASVPQSNYYPPDMSALAAATQPMPQPPRAASGPALVIDATGGVPSTPGGPAGAGSASSEFAAVTQGTARRARASVLANRSTTVAQGTVIPAVLETAFDSTRAGFARAIVSRDVRGFDGTTILIPRGSRLVGEYRSDASPGQKRVMIGWTRLIRPDGMMIAVDSPAVDPLGRGGVRASVDSHFLERLSGAILQSVVQFGSLFTARAATGPVMVVPTSPQNSGPPAPQSGTIAPTLRVRAGTSISVFVAHDLEFGERDR